MKIWEVTICEADNKDGGAHVYEFETENSATNAQVRRHFEEFIKVFHRLDYKCAVVDSVYLTSANENAA